MAQTILAIAASSWAVLMGAAPVLQIRRMLRERSSREVSVGYFTILLVGFLLWICYGAVAGIPALVVPNSVALIAGTAVIIVALRLRAHPHAAGSTTRTAVPGWDVPARRLLGIMKQVTGANVRRWLAGYEAAWRAPGTEGLAGLFTADATYLQSPYEQPVTGLDAIKRMWEEERDGPGEVFTLVTEVLAVDGPTVVVRAEVCYGDPPRQEYRDLWIIRFAEGGRCNWFEEWPYWPGHPHSAREGTA